jgi:hypothetical protein
MFNEDDPEIVADAKAEAERKWGKKSYLLPSTLFRDRAVIQRDLPVPVWGHGVPGTEITVSFADQRKTTEVDEFERWRVTLDPMPASSEGRDLNIRCSNSESRTIRDVLVGDVWVMTGSRQLSSELLRPKAGDAASPPKKPCHWSASFVSKPTPAVSGRRANREWRLAVASMWLLGSPRILTKWGIRRP